MTSIGALTNLQNAIDGMGRDLGPTIDTRVGQTAHYKVYAGSLTSGTPTVCDVFTDLGRFGSRGFLKNTTSTAVSFTVEFSIDGTNYGDSLTIDQGEMLDLTSFILFKKMRLTKVSSNSTYKAMVV